MSDNQTNHPDDETQCHSNQAEAVFKLIGGARALASALSRVGCSKSVSTVYRWSYSRANDGTGGCIPFSALRAVELALNASGIIYPAGLLDYEPAPFSRAGGRNTPSREDLLK